MKEQTFVRAWYASPHRLLELFDKRQLQANVLHALQSPDHFASKCFLANQIGPDLLSFLRKNKVLPLYRLANESGLKPGVNFTYEGHLYGKGFNQRNKTGLHSLSEDVSGNIPGKRLQIEFSSQGLITQTAWSRLKGSTNLFTFCTVAEITPELIRAVPYLIGDMVFGVDELFAPKLNDCVQVRLEEIDQLKPVDFTWRAKPRELDKLKDFPESTIKEIFCKLFNEFEVPKDWGGEECDIFSANATMKGKQTTAAFLLKGPAKFHPMKLTDCGKNGDQIYRLFNIPAELFVLQHCHKVTPPVRKTMEAYSISEYKRSCRFAIVDGSDTACILRHFKMI